MHTWLKERLYDKIFRLPRAWSNDELRKFAHLYTGRAVNISAWKDFDKEGKHYRDYFFNCPEYHLTNYEADACGYQGDQENEVFLDLEKELPTELDGAFDVAFNHTTLEHLFDAVGAFESMCRMTRDSLLIVVPLMQQQHAHFGDYWRFTPTCMDKLFKKNGLEMIYINWNEHPGTSVYLFAVGTRHPERWDAVSAHPDNRKATIEDTFAGTNVVRNNWLHAIYAKLGFAR